MFFVFGWLKEGEHKEPVLNTYCYHCNSVTSWHRYTETEWATFFGIRTLPFLARHFLICDRCHDVFALSRQQGRHIIQLHSLGERQKSQLHDELIALLEQQQLSGKTERQMEYIRAMKLMHEEQEKDSTA